MYKYPGYTKIFLKIPMFTIKLCTHVTHNNKLETPSQKSRHFTPIFMKG